MNFALTCGLLYFHCYTVATKMSSQKVQHFYTIHIFILTSTQKENNAKKENRVMDINWIIPPSNIPERLKTKNNHDKLYLYLQLQNFF